MEISFSELVKYKHSICCEETWKEITFPWWIDDVPLFQNMSSTFIVTSLSLILASWSALDNASLDKIPPNHLGRPSRTLVLFVPAALRYCTIHVPEFVSFFQTQDQKR